MTSFVGSERSGCALSIYNYAKRGLSFYSRGIGSGVATALNISGDDHPPGVQLIALNSITSLGSGSGWQAVIKYDASFDPLDEIELGAWAYVSFIRFGAPYLMVAGRVIGRSLQEASAGGVTTRICTISGAGFEHIWRRTKWFFNVLRRQGPELATNSLIRSIGIEYLLGNPADNVKSILFKFLDIMAGYGRAPYEFPATMPGTSRNASKQIVFDDSQYDRKTLPLTQPIASAAYPNVDLWSMAQEYQDGMFTECWPDLIPKGSAAGSSLGKYADKGLAPANAQWTLVFRDKPFPLVSGGRGLLRGRLSRYFALPTHTIDNADVAALSLGSSEEELFNSFSFANMGSMEGARGFIELQYSQWDTAQQATQGLQKLDFTSMYYATDVAAQADYNRKRMRDWYCLGRELHSGSLQLARGFPEIKVGSRVVVRGATDEDRTTFYVETVRHTWNPGGMKTSLDVTRGYKGTDAQHLARLESEVLDYSDSY